MTPTELRDARATLGLLWGLGRPLTARELGCALRLIGADPGQSIRKYELGRYPISGPVAVAIEAMLAGFRPSPMGV